MDNPTFENHLYVYGSDREMLLELIRSNKGFEEKLDNDLPYLVGQVVWAVRYEMARRIGDVIARRLRALYLDTDASIRMAPKVAEIMALELNKDEDWVKRELTYFYNSAANFTL